MNSIFFTCVYSLLLNFISVSKCMALPTNGYMQIRNSIIKEENDRFFGSNLKLNEDEVTANECLMKAKEKEYDEGMLQWTIL